MRKWLVYACCMFALTMLSGCSTTQTNDEPTTPETFHKGKSTYRISGKTYHVLSSSKNYQEKGVASWYGRSFHSKRTSSGERYNMSALTAAHKTLPLSTYVEVTNLANGKKVIVRVNDRGPFRGNRLIDLSYMAAKQIGMLGRGMTDVTVKAIDKKTAVTAPLFAQNKKLAVVSVNKHHAYKHLAQATRHLSHKKKSTRLLT